MKQRKNFKPIWLPVGIIILCLALAGLIAASAEKPQSPTPSPAPAATAAPPASANDSLSTTKDGKEFSVPDAQKIDNFLKLIAKAPKSNVFLRRGTFSESELNSYLNLVYSKRYAPEVKYINLKLEKENFISGKMKVKLAGKQYDAVPSFLRDFEIKFSGVVQCNKYRMRFQFDEIMINDTGFSPEVLDEAFGAAQGNVKTKRSLFDWFDFLPGIKKVSIDENQITFYY